MLYLSQRFPVVCFPFLRRVYPKENHDFPTTQSRCSQEINNYSLLPVLPCRYVHSFISFRVSYLNTPFQFIRSHIRTSTPHWKQFIHSIPLRSATFHFVPNRNRSVSFIPSLPPIFPPFPAVFIPLLRSIHPEIEQNNRNCIRIKNQKSFIFP